MMRSHALPLTANRMPIPIASAQTTQTIEAKKNFIAAESKHEAGEYKPFLLAFVGLESGGFVVILPTQ